MEQIVDQTDDFAIAFGHCAEYRLNRIEKAAPRQASDIL